MLYEPENAVLKVNILREVGQLREWFYLIYSLQVAVTTRQLKRTGWLLIFFMVFIILRVKCKW